MSVSIIKQGMLDTIQDVGRYGCQHEGINAGGVMDVIAAKLANMLVGNAMDEAVIELHFPASAFYFEKPCMIALSGGDFGAMLNSQPLPLNTACIVGASSLLEFKHYHKGARCYMAVQGGWDAAYWLNSYSTNFKLSMGGYKGRPLKKNDTLHTRMEQFAFAALPKASFIIIPVSIISKYFYAATNVIRCIKGSENHCLEKDAILQLESSSFTISTQSDRMGYRLSGAALQATQTQMVSSAVTRGTIQLLPSGQLIVLMADHQTTGGYPKIAHVISADLPALAQTRPNNSIMFKWITIEEAEEIYLEQQQYLLQLQDACNLQLKQFLANHVDY